MSQLTIVAHVYAEEEKVELVRTELEKLVPITREEAGCVQYDLHQDDDDEAHFMFFENWETREQWLAHMEAPHLKAYGEATDGAVKEFVLFEMTQIA